MGDGPPTAQTAAEVADLLDADGVLVLEKVGQELSVSDLWPAHPSSGALRLQVGFGVTGRVARSRTARLLPEDSPRNPLHRQLLGLDPDQTVARMCLPLFGIHDTVVGVLAAHRAPSHPFHAADQDAVAPAVALLGLRLHAEQLWGVVNRHRTDRDRLIEQAISAQEAERRRIAFDLHDGVTTTLASMAFHVSAADLTLVEAADGEGLAREPGQQLRRARDQLGQVRELTDVAYNQTRVAISGLHSLVLQDLGLIAALESLVQLAGEEGPDIEIVADPAMDLGDVPDHAAAALYRIAQEAISNAVKHSQAERVVVSLRRVGTSIILGCADDGVGFDPDERRKARAADGQHYGLSSMAERCATVEASLRVESGVGRGTTILVELPLSAL